jgi:hypothetical protein
MSRSTEKKRRLVHMDGSSKPPSIHDENPKIGTRLVVKIVIALGIYTYHLMCYDHLLPIFLQEDKVGDKVTILAASQEYSCWTRFAHPCHRGHYVLEMASSLFSFKSS